MYFQWLLRHDLPSTGGYQSAAAPTVSYMESRGGGLLGRYRGEAELLLTFGLYCGSNLLDQPLKDCTRAYLDEARSTVSRP